MNPFRFLKPKNATFCPGCPSKDLALNKTFSFDIPEPETKEEPKKTAKVTTLKDLNKTRSGNNKIQTLF